MLNNIETLNRLKIYLKYRILSYSIFNFKCSYSCVIVPFINNLGGHGLADRLRHCLSIYLFCKKHNKIFKIYHRYPFILEDILTPNGYDWRINDNQFSNSLSSTVFLRILSFYKAKNLDKEDESAKQILKLNKVYKRYKNKQIHIYGSAHMFEEEWRVAFNELFVPGRELRNKLHELNLPEKYDACTLRFQQLLGDFIEGDFEILDYESQKKLIQNCKEEIIYLYESGYFSNKTILVTSDSIKFLNEIKSLPFIKIIPGSIVHPAYSNSTSIESYIKSFVDLYALKGAQTVTLIKGNKMFESGFPEFASKIGSNTYRIHYCNF